MFVPPATNLVQSQPLQPWDFKDKSLVMTRIKHTLLRLFTGLCLLYFLVDLPKHNIFELQNEDLKTLEIIPVAYLLSSVITDSCEAVMSKHSKGVAGIYELEIKHWKLQVR